MASQNFGDQLPRELFPELDCNPLALIEWDSEFRIRRWSHRAQEVFGWKAEEVIGLHPNDFRFVHTSDVVKVNEFMERLASGEIHRAELQSRNYHKDGKVLYCAWYNTVWSDKRGRPVSVVSLVLNETDQKKIEQALERQSERLELALEASGTGFWECDFTTGKMDWTYFGCNLSKTCMHLPVSIKKTFDLMLPEDRQRVTRDLERSIDQGSDLFTDFRVKDLNGRIVWIEIRGRPRKDQDRGTIHMFGTFSDVTDRKNISLMEKKARESAEAASSLKSAFVAGMSHEIRTPLGVILGFAEIMSDPELSVSERTHYMSIIKRNGEHLSRLIEDILDLSKIEADKLEIQRSSFRLEEALLDIQNALQAKAEAKGLNLKLKIDRNLPKEVETDVVRFKQILMNLIGNSIKFTEEGQIDVRVSSGDFQEEKCLKITVADTGIGIRDDDQKFLFEPFVQVDRDYNRRFGGAGLGLALSRKLSRAIGGELSLISSSEEEGSVFEFTLPWRALSVSAEPIKLILPDFSKFRSLEKPLNGTKILLVEDSVDNQVLMTRVLTKRGAIVDVAKDGKDALDFGKERDYDVVLMDIQLPIYDGYEVTRRLRGAKRQFPILALTAHAMRSEKQRCLEAGCNDHLSKPINPDHLVEMILQYTAPMDHQS